MIMCTMTPLSVATIAIALMVTSGRPVSRSKTSARGAEERASSSGGTAVTAIHMTSRVDKRGKTERQEQRARQGAARILQLFRNIDEMLEADEGKDGDQRCSRYSDPGRLIAGRRPNLRKAGDNVGALTKAGDDDQAQAAHLDECHDPGESDRLNRGKTCHDTHRKDHPGNDPRSGDRAETPQCSRRCQR